MTNDVEARELLACPLCHGPAVNVAGDYITCGAPWNGCAGRSLRAGTEAWNALPRAALQPTDPVAGEVGKVLDVTREAYEQGYDDGAEDQREDRAHKDCRTEGYQNWLDDRPWLHRGTHLDEVADMLAHQQPPAGGDAEVWAEALSHELIKAGQMIFNPLVAEKREEWRALNLVPVLHFALAHHAPARDAASIARIVRQLRARATIHRGSQNIIYNDTDATLDDEAAEALATVPTLSGEGGGE